MSSKKIQWVPRTEEAFSTKEHTHSIPLHSMARKQQNTANLHTPP